MTDFTSILDEVAPDQAKNPYAGKQDDEWLAGTISISFLQEHFGEYDTVQEMINATESEGLKLYFAWLQDQQILP